MLLFSLSTIDRHCMHATHLTNIKSVATYYTNKFWCLPTFFMLLTSVQTAFIPQVCWYTYCSHANVMMYTKYEKTLYLIQDIFLLCLSFVVYETYSTESANSKLVWKQAIFNLVFRHQWTYLIMSAVKYVSIIYFVCIMYTSFRHVLRDGNPRVF